MDVWVYVERKEKNAKLKEFFSLEPFSLMIKKRCLRWFGLVEHKDDADDVRCSMIIEG